MEVGFILIKKKKKKRRIKKNDKQQIHISKQTACRGKGNKRSHKTQIVALAQLEAQQGHTNEIYTQ